MTASNSKPPKPTAKAPSGPSNGAGTAAGSSSEKQPQDRYADRRMFLNSTIAKAGGAVAGVAERALSRIDRARVIAGVRGAPLVPRSTDKDIARPAASSGNPSTIASKSGTGGATAPTSPPADPAATALVTASERAGTSLRGASPPADGRVSARRSGPLAAVHAHAPFRPPGALVERQFTSVCDPACEACVTVCPRDCIFKDDAGFPLMDPNLAACDLCMECVDTCPTGALQGVDRRDVWIGTAVLIERNCTAPDGSGCEACVQHCPFPGEALRLVELPAAPVGGQAVKTLASPATPVVDAAHCTGCGLCVEACPEQPKALQVIPWPD